MLHSSASLGQPGAPGLQVASHNPLCAKEMRNKDILGLLRIREDEPTVRGTNL